MKSLLDAKTPPDNEDINVENSCGLGHRRIHSSSAPTKPDSSPEAATGKNMQAQLLLAGYGLASQLTSDGNINNTPHITREFGF